MKHLAIESFLSALREWDEATAEYKAADFHTLIFSINHQIGIKDLKMLREKDSEKFLNTLELRIKYLVDNEKVNEIFLIKSLTNYVGTFFKNMLETHGNGILFHEKMLEEYPELESSKGVLSRLKAPDYVIKIKMSYYKWKEISSIKLSEEQFDTFENELMIEMGKSNEIKLKKLEKEYGNMTLGEIYDKEVNK